MNYKVGDVLLISGKNPAKVVSTNSNEYQIVYWLEFSKVWSEGASSRFIWEPISLESIAKPYPEFEALLKFDRDLEELVNGT